MTNQDSAFSSVSQERRIAELTILCEVSQALQKTVDEEKALYTILAGVTSGRGLGFDRAFILLVDAAAQLLHGRFAVGPSSPDEAAGIWRQLREKHQTLGEFLSSSEGLDIQKGLLANQIVRSFSIPLQDDGNPLLRIMKSHESSRAQDGVFTPHGLPVTAQLTEWLDTGSFGVAPLFFAEKDLGLLIADNAVTREPVEAASLRLLQIYAQAASSAIQNTRLYRELMEKIDVCEQVNANLRESQHHLLLAERLSTIGRMAALLAHEIRTPLVSIGGFARRVLRSTPPDDARREEMEIIVSEVRRLEKLVDEVLGYSRVSRPEYRTTDVNALIRSVMMTLQDELRKDTVDVHLDLHPGLPVAEADEAQLRQALVNLVINAIDAMPSGGLLTLSTKCDGRYFEIGVADTGTGINEEYWDKLFTPFFTTKATGTGLGLAIVSQVIENHNGSLRFESIPGQGTSFHIRLALHPDRAASRSTPPVGDSNSREVRP